MTRRLFVSVSPGEIWAAVVADGDLAELRLQRTIGEARPGDVYLGRVAEWRPELPAALVEIGMARPAFLSGEDVLPGTKPRQGDAVLVQIVKAARADKAAGATMKLKLADRDRAAVQDAARGAAPPLLLRRHETPLAAILGSFLRPTPDEIVLDDRAALAEARAWLKQHRPDCAELAALHGDASPLLEAHGVAAAIDEVLATRVSLSRGAAIAIEPVAAAVAIDVDGGAAGAVAANLEAAAEIARQIRLRDLSGPIVIDFIGMKKRADKARVQAALATATEPDRDIQLLGYTRLGHFELVRKRRRASLGEQLFEYAPGGWQRKTPLTVALEALRQVRRDSLTVPGKRFALRVHPEIAACLDGAAHAVLRDLEARLGRPVTIIAENHARDGFAVVPD
jgi:ribonuclease G